MPKETWSTGFPFITPNKVSSTRQLSASHINKINRLQHAHTYNQSVIKHFYHSDLIKSNDALTMLHAFN